jgi:hypothetical protein
MPSTRQPRPLNAFRDGVNVNDGTMCRQSSPRPKPAGAAVSSKPKRTIKVLALDGGKVLDLLYHVALSEVQWQDLNANSSVDPQPLVQQHKARDLAAKLYDGFLAASARGSVQAKAFLANQREHQKQILQKSQAIYQSQVVKLEGQQKLYSEVAFGAQVVKSAATVGVAGGVVLVAGLFGVTLAGPAIIGGALIGLGYDVSIEIINDLSHHEDLGPNTVVIGFPQATANDAVSIAGSVQQVGADATKAALEKTLSYPLKSSVYRSAASTAGTLDGLLRVLGVLQVGVAIYQETGPLIGAYDQMQSVSKQYNALQSSTSGKR